MSMRPVERPQVGPPSSQRHLRGVRACVREVRYSGVSLTLSPRTGAVRLPFGSLCRARCSAACEAHVWLGLLSHTEFSPIPLLDSVLKSLVNQRMLLAASAGRALSHRCFSLSPRHATLGALGHAGGRNHSREWLLNALRVFSIILALWRLADVFAGAYSRKARTQRGCLLSAIWSVLRSVLSSAITS